MRRSAICAADVMLSASSRMMSLKDAREEPAEEGAEEKALKICLVLEKVLICSLERVSLAWLREMGCWGGVPHDVDAAVVGRVQLEHHLPHVLFAVDVPGEGKDRGGFACAGGPVEEEVW